MLDDIVEIYQEYTGVTVPRNLIPQYRAWGRRAIRALESKLGWQFESTVNINVAGVNPGGCNCDTNRNNLLPAPSQRGTYRVFNFSDKQPFVFVDPFTKIHAVYICRIEPEGRFVQSDDNDVVILQQVDKFAPKYFNGTFGKYIESCEEINSCSASCERGCTECTAILVDADWISNENAPDEVVYMICDYIDWMANGGVASRNVESETVDGHSVKYGGDSLASEPYQNPSDLAIIQQYVGPYGMANRKLIF